MQMTSKIGLPPKLFCASPLLRRITWNFWWPLTLTATPQLTLNWIFHQMSKQKWNSTYNVRGIAHARAHKQKRWHFHAKGNRANLYILEWGQGLVYWQSTHGPGCIPLWGYSFNPSPPQKKRKKLTPNQNLSLSPPSKYKSWAPTHPEMYSYKRKIIFFKISYWLLASLTLKFLTY